MIASIKSEFRKVLSIRSTYVILLIGVALNMLFAFYVTGWQLDKESLMSPTFMGSQVVSSVSALGLFAGIIAILLVTHEYRYNTIMYTLTANKSRTQVLLAKLVTLTVFALIFTAFFAILSPLLSLLAIHIRHLELGAQDFDAWNLAWRSLLSGWTYVIYGFVLAMIIRVQVGTIAALLLIPTVEPLIGLVLKQKQAYLPFMALNNLLTVGGEGGAPTNSLSDHRAAAVVGVYVVVGLLVAWFLFLRRDAN